jgi:hypothetical protein
MSKSLRISDELFDRAKSEAALSHRSPPQQVEHWAQIGRVMESALSYRAQRGTKMSATRRNFNAALDFIETEEGRARA